MRWMIAMVIMTTTKAMVMIDVGSDSVSMMSAMLIIYSTRYPRVAAYAYDNDPSARTTIGQRRLLLPIRMISVHWLPMMTTTMMMRYDPSSPFHYWQLPLWTSMMTMMID